MTIVPKRQSSAPADEPQESDDSMPEVTVVDNAAAAAASSDDEGWGYWTGHEIPGPQTPEERVPADVEMDSTQVEAATPKPSSVFSLAPG